MTNGSGGPPCVMPPSITAIIVTHNRAELLRRCLAQVTAQERPPARIIVVDNASSDHTGEVIAAFPHVCRLRLARNTGGAGGFHLGIKEAIAGGADLVWLMDDDGFPADPSCLRRLIEGMGGDGPRFKAPLVVDVEDPARLAFPIRLSGQSCFTVAEVCRERWIAGYAALFNGALIHASVFAEIGLPETAYFLWGDETEFLYRAKEAGIEVCLDTSVRFHHPSSRAEIFPIMFGLFYAVVPQTAFKRSILFRNRSYIFKQYGMWKYLAADLVRYGWFFLLTSHGDLRGFRDWLSWTGCGLAGRFMRETAPGHAQPSLTVAEARNPS